MCSSDLVADVRVAETQLTEDEAYAVVEKARDIAVERGVGLAQGVVVEAYGWWVCRFERFLG